MTTHTHLQPILTREAGRRYRAMNWCPKNALRHAQYELGAVAPDVSQALDGAVEEITVPTRV
jgi:hypothetical protein